MRLHQIQSFMSKKSLFKRVLETREPTSLTEDTQENIQLLNDVVDFLIKCLPVEFPAEGYGEAIPSEVPGFEELMGKYPEERLNFLVRTFGNIPIKWFNEAIFLDDARREVANFIFTGEYPCFAISISPLLGEVRNISLADVLRVRLKNWTFTSFRAVLVHEARHMVQFCTMGTFYDRIPASYESDPMEIDAFWTHTLNDPPATDFTDASQYADAVMTKLLDNKTLDPGQRTHYRRKTMRYWFDAAQARQAADEKTERKRLKDGRRQAYLDRQKDSGAQS